jgi:Mrp family chromosome partitioning ATPase
LWKPAARVEPPIEDRGPMYAAAVDEHGPACAAAVEDRGPACAAAVEDRGPACAAAVAHLLQEFPPGRTGVLLLCSPGPDDAAAPAVAALAVALASQVTGQILAVDATLDEAGLARHLAPECEAGEQPRAGLADVLAGKVAWQQAVRNTRFGHLDVLPGQAVQAEEPSGPPAARWGAALHQFRQEYQFVLIGVSPADAAAKAIARWADATYLLIHPGRTGRRAARRAVRTLRQCGGRVLGCLLVEHSG